MQEVAGSTPAFSTGLFADSTPPIYKKWQRKVAKSGKKAPRPITVEGLSLFSQIWFWWSILTKNSLNELFESLIFLAYLTLAG